MCETISREMERKLNTRMQLLREFCDVNCVWDAVDNVPLRLIHYISGNIRIDFKTWLL